MSARARPFRAAVQALAYPDFRRIWAAGFVSHIGAWMQIIGRAALAFRITGTTTGLGLVYFFTYIPQLLFSPLGGVLADRFDRRRLLIAAQALSTVLSALMGALTTAGLIDLWSLVAISFVSGTAFALLGPAAQALTPSLVPRSALHSAVSLQSMTTGGTRIFGPALAGLIIGEWGIAPLFYGNALSSLFPLAAWARTHVGPPPEGGAEGTPGAIREGIRFAARTPAVALPVALLAVLSSVGLMYQPLMVAFTTSVLSDGDRELGEARFGLLQATLGAGAVFGTLSFAASRREQWGWLQILTGAGFSVALLGLGLSRALGSAVAFSFVLGAFHFANVTLITTVVQHATPESLRGRVMSLHNIAWVGLFPLASIAAGRIAAAIGTADTLVWAAGVCLASSLVLIPWRRQMSPRVEEPVPPPVPPLELG